LQISLLAHLVVISSELSEADESAMNQVNAGVAPPHRQARVGSIKKNGRVGRLVS
jgi:hypothetical protein